MNKTMIKTAGIALAVALVVVWASNNVDAVKDIVD